MMLKGLLWYRLFTTRLEDFLFFYNVYFFGRCHVFDWKALEMRKTCNFTKCNMPIMSLKKFQAMRVSKPALSQVLVS